MLSSSELAERLGVAMATARDAGALARSFLADPSRLDVAIKGPQDIVTAADAAVERLIIERLATAFPGDGFVGEEGARSNGEHLWVIDPIDGTANFARDVPHWCVSIALVCGRMVELGVIYDPMRDALYSAQRDAGAFCNARALRVATLTDLQHATFEVGYSPRTDAQSYGRCVTRLLLAGANVLQFGSAALGLAWVAAGRLDGYAERHLYAWDALAGLLLVSEAGGRVGPFLSAEALTAGNVTVAAAPALYPALQSALIGD
jgi:myo-inositol-1(or 4)-monophosphatase